MGGIRLVRPKPLDRTTLHALTSHLPRATASLNDRAILREAAEALRDGLDLLESEAVLAERAGARLGPPSR